MEQERIRELLDKYYEGKTSEAEEAQLRSYFSDRDVSSSPGTESGYLADMSPEVPEPSEDFYARLEAVTRGEAEMITEMSPLAGVPPSTDIPLRTVIKSLAGEPPQTDIPLQSVIKSLDGVPPSTGIPLRTVIKSLAGEPPSTGIPLRTVIKSLAGEPPQTRMTPRRVIIRYAMSVAAAAAIMIGIYLIFDYTGRLEMQDTYKDPEIALAEVRNILMTVSEKMTTGIEPLGSINSMNIAPGTLDELGKINSVVGENLSKLRYLDRVTWSQKNMKKN